MTVTASAEPTFEALPLAGSEEAGRLIRSSAIWASLTTLSRILGLVREVLMAQAFGTTASASALVVAQSVPNVSRSLISEEVARGALVPVLTEELDAQREREAFQLASASAACATVIMVVLAAILFAATDSLVAAVAHGHLSGSHNQSVTRHLFRILALLVLPNGIAAASSAMLIARGQFALASAATAIANVPIILLLFLDTHPSITLAAWAIVAGFALQACYQAIAVWRGASSKYSFALWTPKLRTVAWLAVPVALTLGAATFSGLIDIAFSGLVSAGAPAALDKAFRLMLVPYGAIAVAIGVVSLPTLVRYASAPAAFERELARAVRLQLAVLLPLGAALIVLAKPVVVLAFQRGSFTASSVSLTVSALTGMALVLPAMGLSLLGSRAWLSRQRPWPAAAVAAGGLALNAGLDWVFVGPLGLFGICLSTAVVHFAIGTILLALAATHPKEFLGETAAYASRVIAICMIAVGAFAGISRWVAIPPIIAIAAFVVGAAPVYYAGAKLLHIQEIDEIVAMARPLFRRGRHA